MKRIFAFILAISILPVSAQTRADGFAPGTSASAATLIHADTETVLYERNADERMLIASTTKVMTALTALDFAQPDDSVIIPTEATRIEGSSMYLKPGGTYSVGDLLTGLLLVSGNDAALALAYHIGGSVEAFADLMNAKAAQLGLENTSFKNPHGLDAEGHYSTARDLALIMKAAMENDTFREISGTKARNIGELTYVNHNKLLWRYNGTTGGKTGYTMASGRSLISCAERDDLSLICVTLNDPDDWNDHAALYDWGFANYAYDEVRPASEIRIPVISGVTDSVGVALSGELSALTRRGAETQVRLELPRFVFAAVRAGDPAGRLVVMSDGESVGEIGLHYSETVPSADEIRLNFRERFKRSWQISRRFKPTLIMSHGPLMRQ